MGKKIFVFCIGGTGLRVMKSIIMLLAAGMKTNGYIIIPIIIDPHDSLTEKINLNNLIEDYKKIYKNSISNSGSNTGNPLEGFFGCNVMRLEDLNDQQNSNFAAISDQRPFKEFLGTHTLADSETNSFLLKTLFSEANLTNQLSVGFKGNPNVGTVVLHEMVSKSAQYKAFLNHCQAEDRVFIISSIFGGTGASGYPLIEKLIHEEKDNQQVSKVLMGAISVLPYFTLKDPTQTSSDIDSATFLSKTKAALTYYENNVKSDYLYYIGDKSMSATYDNNEIEQKDTANFIELVAASALFHFSKQEKPSEPQCLSRAIKTDSPSLSLTTAGDSYKPIIKAVADMMMLKKLVNSIKKESQYPLQLNRHWDDKFWSSQEFLSFQKFLDNFNNWYQELASNKRSFSPLNTTSKDEIKNSFIKDMTIQGADDISQYLLEVIKASNKDTEEKHDNRLRQLLKFSYVAINKYTSQI